MARAAAALGSARERRGDRIDLAVGVELAVEVGDRVAPGAPLARLYANDEGRLGLAAAALRAAITVQDGPTVSAPLILDRVGFAAKDRG